MNQSNVQVKLQNLEAEIKLLKISVSKRPDFDIDETNWKKIGPALKKARSQTAKEIYG